MYYCRKAQKIICFEPNKENFLVLKKNVEINKIKNVELFNKAVYPANKDQDLFYPEGSNYDAFSLVKVSKHSNKVKVFHPKKLVKLSGEKNIIKMDCEGSEFKIFPYLNLDKIDEIIAEYHLYEKEINHLSDIVKRLKKKNFRIIIKPYSKNEGLIHAFK